MKILHKHQRSVGAKKSPIKFYTDTQPRDINGDVLPFAVGLVASCVAHYRVRNKGLKNIYLHPKLFNEFELWSKHHMTEQEADTNVINYTFDGVFILPGSVLMKDQITWDFYPVKIDD